VRFKLTETLNTSDPDLVLEALERGLAPVSKHIVRSGNELTAYGIGPSPRAMNPHDTTVIHADSEGTTMHLTADVTYQASALLADTSQDEVVRAKIDRVLDQIRSDLKYGALSTRSAPLSTAAPIPISEPAQHQFYFQPEDSLQPEFQGPIPDIPPEISPDPPSRFAHGFEQEQPDAAPEQQQEEPPLQLTPPQPDQESISPHLESGYAHPASSLSPVPTPLRPISSPSHTPLAKSKPLARTPTSSHPGKNLNSRALALSVLAALAVLTAGAYYRPDLYLRTLQIISTPLEKLTTLITGKPDSRAASSQAATQQPALPASAQPVNPPSTSTTPEIISWLQRWAAALQSEDGALQASFYADKVDRFYLASNLTRDDIYIDRQAEIYNRLSPIQVKLEKVKIQNESPTSARIILVKHIISGTHKHSDQYVPCQIILHRTGGDWKITSERGLK
jgi:hypothetical protein